MLGCIVFVPISLDGMIGGVTLSASEEKEEKNGSRRE
jgi:hypothetical protein